MSDITTRLSDLGRRAPHSVSPIVLLETGLADGIVERSTPAGPLLVAFNPRGVSATSLSADRERFVLAFSNRFGRPAFPVTAMPAALSAQLDRSLVSGRAKTLPLDLRSVTPFQRTVLEVVAKIPPGQVRPYGWVARESGRPGASRAVGTTMARNPIPVLIPCHRVIRSDGHLGNYLFGVDAKTTLLEAEGLDTVSAERNASAGRLWLGSDTTHIVCHPSCAHARRITAPHQVWFRSLSQASEAGFRGCLACRPAA